MMIQVNRQLSSLRWTFVIGASFWVSLPSARAFSVGGVSPACIGATQQLVIPENFLPKKVSNPNDPISSPGREIVQIAPYAPVPQFPHATQASSLNPLSADRFEKSSGAVKQPASPHSGRQVLPDLAVQQEESSEQLSSGAGGKFSPRPDHTGPTIPHGEVNFQPSASTPTATKGASGEPVNEGSSGPFIPDLSGATPRRVVTLGDKPFSANEATLTPTQPQPRSGTASPRILSKAEPGDWVSTPDESDLVAPQDHLFQGAKSPSAKTEQVARWGVATDNSKIIYNTLRAAAQKSAESPKGSAALLYPNNELGHGMQVPFNGLYVKQGSGSPVILAVGGRDLQPDGKNSGVAKELPPQLIPIETITFGDPQGPNLVATYETVLDKNGERKPAKTVQVLTPQQAKDPNYKVRPKAQETLFFPVVADHLLPHSNKPNEIVRAFLAYPNDPAQKTKKTKNTIPKHDSHSKKP